MGREDALSYLALGDSYTAGEGVTGGERWTSQLVRILRENGIGISFPRTIAVTGWTCDELAAGMRDAHPPLANDYDFVSLLIGVNDQYRNCSVDDYGPRFESLLKRAVELAKGRADRVVVLGIPDWSVTPFAQALQPPRDLPGVSRELDEYNAAANAICAAHGVAFVDHSSVSRELGADPAMLADDGLHPNSGIYRAWAELSYPVVRRLLAR